MGPSSPEVDQRIGWLLRCWRLHLRPVDNARTFAGELTTTGIAADVSRVSRWETGQAPVPLDVLRSYEQLLGVPGGSLSAVAATLRRAEGHQPPATRFTPRRLQDAFDRLYDADPLGADWLQLAALVATKPDLVTLPRQVWWELTSRLVVEISMSVGHAYLARAEAANLLTGHRHARTELVRAAGAYVLCDSPDQDPGNDGSLTVVLDQLGHGRLDPAVVSTMHGRAEALFQRYGGRGSASDAALGDLVRALPASAQGRLLELGAEPERPEPDPQQRAFSWSRRLLDGTGHEDPMLHWLVSEALFGATFTARASASALLAAAPARADVAAGTAALLPGVPLPVVLRLAELLTYVGTDAERGVIHGLVAQSTGRLRLTALAAAGHLPPGAPVPELATLVSGPDEVLSRQALHSAGMVGHPLLADLAADATTGRSQRFLAAWWLSRGPALREE